MPLSLLHHFCFISHNCKPERSIPTSLKVISMFFTSSDLQIMFVIAKPDVFKSPNADTYIIFGEAKIEDLGAQAQAHAAQSFLPSSTPKAVQAADVSASAADEDDDEEVEATGIEEKDIELVMDQAGVSRVKAIKALKHTGSDIVSAIMELTM